MFSSTLPLLRAISVHDEKIPRNNENTPGISKISNVFIIYAMYQLLTRQCQKSTSQDPGMGRAQAPCCMCHRIGRKSIHTSAWRKHKKWEKKKRFVDYCKLKAKTKSLFSQFYESREHGQSRLSKAADTLKGYNSWSASSKDMGFSRRDGSWGQRYGTLAVIHESCKWLHVCLIGFHCSGFRSLPGKKAAEHTLHQAGAEKAVEHALCTEQSRRTNETSKHAHKAEK